MAAASSSDTSLGTITYVGTFSQGKDILKAKTASLADETFEMLNFMRDKNNM